MFKRDLTERASEQMQKALTRDQKIKELGALLKWYEASGVGDAIAETPINWLGEDSNLELGALQNLKQAKVRQKRQENQTPANTQSSPPPKTAPLSIPSIREANELAAKAGSLIELQTALEGFEGCALKRTAKNLVFYRGAVTAPLMIIGEAPGRDEDIAGKPFVGRAGNLLDKMLQCIKINEENCHITNIVYWRPPGNRTPTTEEGLICRPFLERQIKLVNPKIILLVGGSAAKQLLDTTTGIMKLRGTWKSISIGGKNIKTLATLHPAYLLRTPIAKRLAWQDLQELRTKLQENN